MAIPSQSLRQAITSSLRKWGAASVCAAVLVWMNPLTTFAFGVAPALIELEGQRGQVIEESFELLNTSTAEQTYYFGTLKFAPRDNDSGAPQFIPYDVDHAGLPEWIRFDQEALRVPARSKVEVPFEVAIPSETTAGGHYAAITVSRTPSEVVATNGARVEAKTALLLFLKVDGETIERAALLDANLSATMSLSGDISYRLQNQGNTHVQPTGSLTATDLFGRTWVLSQANPEELRILPNTTRTLEGSFASPSSFMVGPVDVTLDVNAGADADSIQKSWKVWVVTWPALTVAAGILALLIVLGIVWKKQR